MADPGDPSRESDRLDAAPRPRDTDVLFGHGQAERAMLDAYRSGRLAHAWLIGGPQGIGKATLAWRFARFLLAYPDPSSAAVRAATDLAVPLDHPVRARLRSGAQADVAVLRRQWNDKTKRFFTDIRVDDVRGALQLFRQAAGAGGFRICILDSAEDLNRSSANALLKVIEEPPPRSLFLVVSHRPTQVMPTILSRCRKLFLGALGTEDVRAAVTTAAKAGGTVPHGLDEILARGGGSAGRALQLLDATRRSLDGDLRAELNRLPAVDWRALHRLADRMGGADGGEAGATAVETVLDWLDERVRVAARGAAGPRRLAPLAEVWERVRVLAREAEALNLDRRPLLLSVFADLAQATRTAGL